MPLLDDAYVRDLRRYLATFRPRPRRPLFFASRNPAWTWQRQAEERAQAQGIGFAISPLSPKTFRHRYAMHLFFNHVPPKVVQTCIGHERYESTEVYLKVFALDVTPQLGIRFTLDPSDIEGMLTRK